ncbi:hypothetical protein DENSPDRAFT_833441 [Dentipellis sp. KUC8613]|nr:hypothetical protein DENSPDRAFT_833441 [Dentipellis sp. KUC8613]
MAALVLNQSRFLLPNWRAAFFSVAAAVPAFNWTAPSIHSLLELLPPFLLAVPKKKVSHSRKAMRSANKGLKDKQNLVHCPGCGSVKLAHHLCPTCYSAVNRAWKSKAKAEGSGPYAGPAS